MKGPDLIRLQARTRNYSCLNPCSILMHPISYIGVVIHLRKVVDPRIPLWICRCCRKKIQDWMEEWLKSYYSGLERGHILNGSNLENIWFKFNHIKGLKHRIMEWWNHPMKWMGLIWNSQLLRESFNGWDWFGTANCWRESSWRRFTSIYCSYCGHRFLTIIWPFYYFITYTTVQVRKGLSCLSQKQKVSIVYNTQPGFDQLKKRKKNQGGNLKKWIPWQLMIVKIDLRASEDPSKQVRLAFDPLGLFAL